MTMADERDFELLDDYLTNRMSDQDRSAFEQKLEADPDLQHEYALQKRLIQGIKDARVAELKSMLKNVPVPSAGTGNTVATKIILGTVLTLMIAAAALWYFKNDEEAIPSQKANSEEQVPEKKSVERAVEPEAKPESKSESTTTREKQAIETDKNQTSAGTEHSKPSLAKKPAPLAAPGERRSERDGPVLDAATPDSEDSSGERNNIGGDKPATTPGNSSLMIETERNNARYAFHYQFRDGKLILFGPFEKNLYEVIELSKDAGNAFLYYKDQYYPLDASDEAVRPLTAVSDSALLKKLRDYRNGK